MYSLASVCSNEIDFTGFLEIKNSCYLNPSSTSGFDKRLCKIMAVCTVRSLSKNADFNIIVSLSPSADPVYVLITGRAQRPLKKIQELW